MRTLTAADVITVANSSFTVSSGTVTSNQGTSPWVTNITQFGSNNVITGTGVSGLGIPRITVSNDSNILSTQSGVWNITNISGTISLPTGASTSAKQPALGTAGVASADVISIQGIASMTKLLTTPDNPPNLDVALSTRLKPADTLTGVTTVSTVTTLSQFPSTAALADATANPTLTKVQSFPMVLGTSGNWDRAIGPGQFNQSTLNGVLNTFTSVGTGLPASLVMGWDNTANSQSYRVVSVDSGGRINTNFLTVAGFGIQTQAGASGQGTLRVVTATDSTIGTVTTLSQLPSTGALADATANPTLTQLQVFPMGYNGATWDRLQVDASKFLKVNVAAALPTGANVVGGVTQSGTWTVQPGNTANTTPWLSKINDGTNSATVSTESLNTNLNRLSGFALNTYSAQITTNTTTTPTSATGYISSIAITTTVGGTGSTVTIQDKQGTPLKLLNLVGTTVTTGVPTTISFPIPVKMVSGIDIVTAGAVAATIQVWISYWA